ncbi:serine acetyltransferase [Bradyrhizobium huanghuaihaiense]|uniref:serine O-acetyltransferase n=1 Tax=Bradyrhizobium huanghuaihaiense TaxID=990078 RepID=UPI0021AAADF3|nr:serine acetyltransferase [Bradyrhizobium sp. CB3035]UWU75159.1 serine acetyltransferase [Bradyrhizobium sp. CB3035]
MGSEPQAGIPWREDLMANTGKSGVGAAFIALLTSPGFAVITTWRIAKMLRFQTRWGHQITWLLVRALMRRGCYISVLAEIGPGLILPHPTGVVIGEGARIGRSVMLYHNVTLGRRAWDEPGCPTIGDNVVIYTGAVIVGPTSIGEGANVAANAVVTRDVPPHAVAAGAPARVVRSQAPGRMRA